MRTLRFTPAHLAAFSDASHDRNPLHLSEDHARKAPFGERVVFGVLSGLAALAELPAREDRAVSSIQLDFVSAAVLDVTYTARAEESGPERAMAFVLDGRRPLLNASIRTRPATALPHADPPASSSPARAEPVRLGAGDMHQGRTVRGTYAPSWEALHRLSALLGLRPPLADAMTLAVLLWSSYLVGMELPGERALFAGLLVEYTGAPVAPGPFAYEARITGTTPRGAHRIAATLHAGGVRIADVTLDVVVREDSPVASVADVERYVGRDETMAGKTALVTGGSRGLGAALVQGLALKGATVVATYLRSSDEATRLQEALAGAPGRLRFVQGDAGDPDFWRATHAAIQRDHGRLDILVCNASPPIQPSWLETSAVTRVNDFITKSVAMVSCPMAALLPMLQQAKGWLTLVSSQYVEALPADFPHYNAAKAAAEALVRTAVGEYRMVSGLVVRPPKLLTDQTNTPLGKRGALAVERVAASTVARLGGPACSGKIEVVSAFS
ncbi:SDR family NAD(P)-dependent oxidoreductase [Polyangium sorediatum]|uniref:SDR family NAD(P)-dependent oxidoreductase n=1 Tax=Polyangium sorediatum TaxID=889274 RepID=A0ABT6NYG4_9BACT|nr:SDR family NAD(P)-dependent oxidoreductase [Polyangium sorediatum]MDI1433386.1 SDR family NAD(P)-dependent oxidoreductase [Polyangium sorediatum]